MAGRQRTKSNACLTSASEALPAPPAVTTEPGAIVSWEGAGQSILLKTHGPNGEATMPLTPPRALELAKEMIEPAVQAIKVKQWGSGWPD